MSPTLTKTQVILYLLNWRTPVYVGVAENEMNSSVIRLEMDKDAWIDMDCPSKITITVEPGDKLNEDA